LSVEPIEVGFVADEKPAQLMFPGIYAFSLPDDSEIVYVGKTRTNTILQRILDHKNISTNSDMRGMLKNNSDMPQNIESYKLRYLPVTDDRERGFLEYFCIGILKPRLNK